MTLLNDILFPRITISILIPVFTLYILDKGWSFHFPTPQGGRESRSKSIFWYRVDIEYLLIAYPCELMRKDRQLRWVVCATEWFHRLYTVDGVDLQALLWYSRILYNLFLSLSLYLSFSRLWMEANSIAWEIGIGNPYPGKVKKKVLQINSNTRSVKIEFFLGRQRERERVEGRGLLFICRLYWGGNEKTVIEKVGHYHPPAPIQFSLRRNFLGGTRNYSEHGRSAHFPCWFDMKCIRI
jgi:hypothetical protein